MKTKLQKLQTVFAALTLIATLFTGLHASAQQLPPAQNPTALPFLVSKEVLMTYAVDQAYGGYDYLSANQFVWASGTYFSIPSNHTSRDIIAAINATHSTIDIYNVNDTIFKFITVNNIDGDELFVAKSFNRLNFGPGGYNLPAFDFTLELSPTIPVSFASPVSSAYMEYTDASGADQYSGNYNYYANKVYIPVSDAGQGQLHVQLKNGSNFVFDLRQDGRQVGQTVLNDTTSGTGNIDNFFSFAVTGATNIMDVVQAYNGYGDNHVYELIVHTAAPTAAVTLNIRTSEGNYPKGFMFRLKNTSDQLYLNVNAMPAFLTNGTWYVIPVWDSISLSPPQNDTGLDGSTIPVISTKGAGTTSTLVTSSGQ